MSIKYIESFTIPGLPVMGIQDVKHMLAPGENFYCWAGGCGVGGDVSLEAARLRLYTYAKANLAHMHGNHERMLAIVDGSLAALGENDVFQLGVFKTKEVSACKK